MTALRSGRKINLKEWANEDIKLSQWGDSEQASEEWGLMEGGGGEFTDHSTLNQNPEEHHYRKHQCCTSELIKRLTKM